MPHVPAWTDMIGVSIPVTTASPPLLFPPTLEVSMAAPSIESRSHHPHRHISVLRWDTSSHRVPTPSLPEIPPPAPSASSSVAQYDLRSLVDVPPRRALHLTRDGSPILCRVCLVSLSEKTSVERLECGHVFHEKCVHDVSPQSSPQFNSNSILSFCSSYMCLMSVLGRLVPAVWSPQ